MKNKVFGFNLEGQYGLWPLDQSYDGTLLREYRNGQFSLATGVRDQEHQMGIINQEMTDLEAVIGELRARGIDPNSAFDYTMEELGQPQLPKK